MGAHHFCLFDLLSLCFLADFCFQFWLFGFQAAEATALILTIKLIP